MDLTNLTSLPTDSLYKFMALAGLLVIAATVSIPLYFRKSKFFQIIDVKRKLEIARLKFEKSVEEIEEAR